MPPVTGASSLPLQLEAVAPTIAEIVESDGRFARLVGAKEATAVSLRAFRAQIKSALSGQVAFVNLDTGSFPAGTGNKYDQMLLQPLSWMVPIQYSKLAQLVTEGQSVASANAVTDTIGDVARQVMMWRDIFLQGPGDGSLGSIDSTTGANFINLRSSITAVVDGRGAHQVKPQQTVQIMSPGAYVLRGTCTIQQVFPSLGSTQQIQVDAIPPNTAAGDLIIVGGLTPGAPQGISGISLFINTSTLGNLYGIPKSLPYVVANGVNLLNQAQVSKPVFRTAYNQIIQRMGEDAVNDHFWHTHPSQLQSLEELAFNDTFLPLDGGKAKSYDPLFEDFTICGRPVYKNIHADMTRWDLVSKQVWNFIKWGTGKFWFKNRGNQMVFQVIDSNTGMPTAQEVMYYTVCEQAYVNNPTLQGGVTGCKIPVNN